VEAAASKWWILRGWFTLAGMVAGYLLMHPFAMLAYTLGPQSPHAPMDISIWGHQMHLAFGAEMLAMGGAFAFMGGVAGFCLGAWYLQKERWTAAKIDSEKRLVALETLRDLMVTLAHHIRNSNMVIGGFSARLSKHVADPELQRQLQAVRQACREIDAVIDSLQNLTEISTVKYITDGQARIIDLKNELEARLAVKATEEQNES
jgi:signal transduction histidine kinase